MTKYTPTTEEVRGDYAHFQVRTDATYAEKDYAAAASEFDRWLAAHDAEVRAGVVAKEPEWEYAYDSIADAEAERPSVRRRKAGPWLPMPVQQGDE